MLISTTVEYLQSKILLVSKNIVCHYEKSEAQFAQYNIGLNYAGKAYQINVYIPNDTWEH